MKEVNVDLISQNRVQGEVATHLQHNGALNVGMMKPYVDSKGRICATVYKGGDPKKPTSYHTMILNSAPNPLQTNATLRRDEWKQLDDAVLLAARERLGAVQDLIDAGLVFNLGNAMGTTVLEWHDVNDGQEAAMTMDGINRGKGDRPDYRYNYLPIPIIHVDYEINARQLSASRNMGNPIDTSDAENAARRISEKLENLLCLNTETYSFGTKDARSRNTIYGYTNHPDRTTQAIGTHWDDLNSNIGSTIVNQVADMKQASINARHYGPWHLYIPTNYETVMDLDYDATSGTTIRERILKIEGIKKVKVLDSLPLDNVVLVQMTRNVVRLVQGFGITNVQWAEEGGMVTKFKVMTIQVPQIRSDYNNRTGLVHLA